MAKPEITLSNLSAVVAQAKADLAAHDAYVLTLGARLQAGEKTIQVFDKIGNQWTTVKLQDFWQVQYDKYIAMAGYTGEMDGLLVNLNNALAQALPTILLPEDRVAAKAAAEAK